MSALLGVDINTLWRRLWIDDLAGCLQPFHIEQLVALVQRWVPLARREAATTSVPALSVAPVIESERPVLDTQAAMQRLGGDQVLLDSLFPLLAEELPDVCAVWQAWVDTEQWQAAADCVHGLKGSASAVGAERLAAVAAQVERACRQAPQVPLDAGWARLLQAAVDATAQALSERERSA